MFDGNERRLNNVAYAANSQATRRPRRSRCGSVCRRPLRELLRRSARALSRRSTERPSSVTSTGIQPQRQPSLRNRPRQINPRSRPRPSSYGQDVPEDFDTRPAFGRAGGPQKARSLRRSCSACWTLICNTGFTMGQAFRITCTCPMCTGVCTFQPCRAATRCDYGRQSR